MLKSCVCSPCSFWMMHLYEPSSSCFSPSTPRMIWLVAPSVQHLKRPPGPPLLNSIEPCGSKYSSHLPGFYNNVPAREVVDGYKVTSNSSRQSFYSFFSIDQQEFLSQKQLNNNAMISRLHPDKT